MRELLVLAEKGLFYGQITTGAALRALANWRNLLNFSNSLFWIYLSFVILGLFFLYFLRPNILNVGEYLRVKWPNALVSGFFGLFLAPVVFAALLGTVIGIFLAPVFAVWYVFFILFAFYSAAIMLGETIVKIFTYRDHIYLEMFLGATALFFCPFIPYIGRPLFFILLLLGMGGALNQRFGAE
jgi:hypothetical protein